MLLETLGAYVEAERTRALPEGVMHHAKRAVIDWFAATYPGAVMAPNPNLREALAEELGHGRAVVLPSGERAPARTAAFLNGASAHTSEFDDIFRDAAYHPGSATVAAALAMAQAKGSSGETFLRAVIAGYEVSTRIALALGRSHYARWHTTATISTFGATCAAAVVLGLNATQTAHAIANAATMAAGLQQAFRSGGMSKPLHGGHAAEAGVTCAMGAAQGVTGTLDVLDGEVGFGVVMSDGADWSKATASLGEEYNIGRMTVKNHGCCGHTFAAIDAVLALRVQHGLTPDTVASIHAATYGPAIEICNRPDPHTPTDCRFSIQYVMAHALMHGSVRLAAFMPDHFEDPALRAILPRISASVDPELDARFPGQRAARVTIETTDGRSLAFFQPTRRGDPDAPLTDTELDAKFTELAGDVLPAAQVETLLTALRGLEARRDMALPGATLAG
jgi:2-methylcitrate dehydratase PrpD